MPVTTTLTERRKADRAKMAAELHALAQRLGATVDLVLGSTVNMFTLRISTPRGLQVSVELDGKSIQPDVHVIPWHMHYESHDKLSPAFGEVNPHHHRKATQVAWGWAQLQANIERGLTMAADGSAFQPPTPSSRTEL